ncbi:uncharacterized protein LOC129001017 [Macrosteles quadrilineatus]|uniref:uncharacterized protein LOC129001017 n=1 Tax=Macrosteles quadrilineatus TaxID=74068 RepID=UPI0023E1C6A2|nr:uncharacterized protein LOC129001017 [Macrosteles quadrilineatus]
MLKALVPSPIAKQIIDTYLSVCRYTEEPVLTEERRKPFIVIEGNHRSSKTVIGQKLAQLLGGRLISQVAPCLRKYSTQLMGSHPLRRPLQFLSLYATAFDAKVQISLDRPVVVNSYWTEQLAFTVTRVFHAGALPPISAEFFHYPEDLLRPDLHIFLDFGEAVLTTTPAYTVHYAIVNYRKTSNLRKRKLELYRHMQSEVPIHIHELERVTHLKTAKQLVEVVRANLSQTRDLTSTSLLDY